VSFLENVWSLLAFLFVMVGTLLFWLLDWMFGLIFTVFVIIVMLWYLRTKRSGDVYLEEVAKRTQCKFKGGGFGYGSVYGDYRGHKIEITVDKTLDTGRSLTGLIISSSVLQSAVGGVAGMRNFTAVRVGHRARVEEPYRIDDRTYVDKQLILYLPESNGATGLPKSSARSLVKKIDEIITKAEEIENEAEEIENV